MEQTDWNKNSVLNWIIKLRSIKNVHGLEDNGYNGSRLL